MCGISLAVQWLDSALPMQGVQVPSLVGELISHILCSQKKKEFELCGEKKKERKKEMISYQACLYLVNLDLWSSFMSA